MNFNLLLPLMVNITYFDQELIPKFNEYLDQEINKPLFVVIHLMGTHFKYENRYPDSLKNKFNSALNKSLSKKEKNNKYDRAVLNTDYVISEIIVCSAEGFK